MAYRRTAVKQFELANDAYINSVLTFYAIDPETNFRTNELITLYEAPVGSGTYSNPHTLDGQGKFAAPVYIDQPCIISIRETAVGNHDTGIIYPLAGQFKEEWVTEAEYIIGDIVIDGADGDDTGNLYIAAASHTSGDWDEDITDGFWEMFFDVSTIAEFAERAETAAEAAEDSEEAANTSATNAAAANTSAGIHAANAETAAALAATFLRFTTSSTSLTVNTSQKTLTVAANRQFVAGDFLILSRVADPTTYMWGQIDSYTFPTLVMTPVVSNGSGTHTDWNVAVSGARGPQGPSGSGTGDMLAANNLSDLVSIPTARVNLSLVPGTDVEVYSPRNDAAAKLFLSTNLT